VTHDPTRKHFFAKLAGMAAAVSLFPKSLARPNPAVAGAEGAGAPALPIEIRGDSRAIARRSGAL
jgi:hypothetical protein